MTHHATLTRLVAIGLGVTGKSNANPENHSAAAPSSQGMPSPPARHRSPSLFSPSHAPRPAPEPYLVSLRLSPRSRAEPCGCGTLTDRAVRLPQPSVRVGPTMVQVGLLWRLMRRAGTPKQTGPAGTAHLFFAG